MRQPRARQGPEPERDYWLDVWGADDGLPSATVTGITQTKDKAARVSAFSVPVENGSLRLWGEGVGQVHPSQQALFDEMTTFPFGEHDDLLDAAAFGTAHLLDRPEPRVF